MAKGPEAVISLKSQTEEKTKRLFMTPLFLRLKAVDRVGKTKMAAFVR